MITKRDLPDIGKINILLTGFSYKFLCQFRVKSQKYMRCDLVNSLLRDMKLTGLESEYIELQIGKKFSQFVKAGYLEYVDDGLYVRVVNFSDIPKSLKYRGGSVTFDKGSHVCKTEGVQRKRYPKTVKPAEVLEPSLKHIDYSELDKVVDSISLLRKHYKEMSKLLRDQAKDIYPSEQPDTIDRIIKDKILSRIKNSNE